MKEKIPLHNNGNHFRDFTYIDDIINGIYLAMNNVPKSKVPSVIYNLGNNKEVSLAYFLRLIEKYSNKKAICINLPLQKGDIIKTKADIKLARKNWVIILQLLLKKGSKILLIGIKITIAKKI